MKQFFTIFKHELAQYFKNKVFVITTIVLVLSVSGLLFAPRIGEVIKKSQNTDSSETKKTEVLIKSNSSEINKVLPTIVTSFPQANVKITNDSIEQIKSKIKDQSVNFAFILSSDLKSYTYLTNVSILQDPNLQTMDTPIFILKSTAFPTLKLLKSKTPILLTLSKVSAKMDQRTFGTHMSWFLFYIWSSLYLDKRLL